MVLTQDLARALDCGTIQAGYERVSSPW